MQRYIEGKISGSERRVLVTKWVGKAWTEVGSNRDMVVRRFKKCGISLSLDGSKNGEIHIESIRNTNCQQLMKYLNLNLIGKGELKMMKIILK